MHLDSPVILAGCSLLIKLPSKSSREALQRLPYAGHVGRSLWARQDNQIEPGREFVLQMSERLPDASLPPAASDRIAHPTRNNQSEARIL
jgi:hypothetical protein